ncbi:MAG TPA: two-component regulator propeller domain-containing protein, partial [Bacteroidota bacterium]|nr:two-component regulator propeller domain-containing protein [Bacteroidota bacterium]
MSLILIAALSVLQCDSVPHSNIHRGPKWVNLNRSNSGLLANTINCLFTDGAGEVWVGTDSGASRYFDGSWAKFTDSISHGQYFCVFPLGQ